MKRILLVLAVVCLFVACRSSRAIGRAVGKKDSTTTTTRTILPDAPKTDTQQHIQTTLAQLQKNHIAFTTFNAKLGIDYKGTDGKGRDVNANIKMYRDSAIWVSVNAILGIEAIRLLITKDSVKLLNKLEKTYAARGISFLQEATSLPLDLSTLQNLIIGNPVYVDSNITRYSVGNGMVSLVSLGVLFKNLLTLNDVDKTILHSKLTDIDPFRNRTADLAYSEYENNKGFPFSKKRQIVVSERGRLEIKLDFKNYTFNEEVSFPFSVPKNYARL
ncbi:MAG: DUF4292 domain-containing protein [Chitinophagaceae bacterium]|nr:MAG: DUF4292 domain-containing protein [Chitinophagaceae bacterium]